MGHEIQGGGAGDMDADRPANCARPKDASRRSGASRALRMIRTGGGDYCYGRGVEAEVTLLEAAIVVHHELTE